MNDDINISNDRDLLDDDTTGHAMRGKVQPAEDDTGGHGRWSPAPQVTEDDTEAHAMRGKVQPADDDTEGHAARGKA